MLTESAGYQYILQQGWQEGWKKGLAKGIAEGIEKGIAEGIAEGIEKRRAEGLEKGLEEGLRTGLLDGIALILDLRFGLEGMKLMPDIEKISEVSKLQIIQKALRSVDTPDELREFIAAL